MGSMEKVAFLGLGTMGAAMAANLARAGFAVTAWNRTPDRAPELADLGVDIARSPAEAVADTPIVVILIGLIGGTLSLGLTGLFLGPIVLAVIWELVVAWIRENESA